MPPWPHSRVTSGHQLETSNGSQSRTYTHVHKPMSHSPTLAMQTCVNLFWTLVCSGCQTIALYWQWLECYKCCMEKHNYNLIRVEHTHTHTHTPCSCNINMQIMMVKTYHNHLCRLSTNDLYGSCGCGCTLSSKTSVLKVKRSCTAMFWEKKNCTACDANEG